MRRILAILIFISIIVGCSQNKEMNFETYTKQLFLNADITKNDTSLLSYYKKHGDLNEVKYEGFTTYPPLSALGQEEFPKKYIFQFKFHPKILFDFREGELIVQRTNREQQHSPVLKFNFDTQEQAEKAFQVLVNDFEGVSEKKRIREREWGKIAEFSDDEPGSVHEIMFSYMKGDILVNGYTLIIMLANDLESPKE